jgi:hypothetical protein
MVNHPLHGERRVDVRRTVRADRAIRVRVAVSVLRPAHGSPDSPGAPIVRILGKCGPFKFS